MKSIVLKSTDGKVYSGNGIVDENFIVLKNVNIYNDEYKNDFSNYISKGKNIFEFSGEVFFERCQIVWHYIKENE